MKKVKAASIIVGLLVSAGALSFIAAGGQDGPAVSGAPASDANVNAPGAFPIVKTPVTLNVAINPQVWVENYETNLYTKMLEEKSGIDLQFELFPTGTPGLEKFLVTVAGGGPLPEAAIQFSFSEEIVYNLGQDGIFLKLNDYYDKWAYYFPKQLEKVADKNIWQWVLSADGNVYYVPFIAEQIGEIYPLRGWMNTDWLDKLGLKTPITTDEFRVVLEAFRDRDPNGNGQKDEIPSGGNTDQRGRLHDFLINAFIYNDQRDRLMVNNGRVDVIYNKPEYRDALRYINGLINDGLIFDRLFTVNGPGLRAIIESQDVSTVGFFTAGLAGAIGPTNRMRLEYEPIPPLKGPRGVQWTPYMPIVPATRFVITRDCKNPEAAFRLADFMCSEEATLWNRFGVPEKDWRLPRSGERSMYDSVGMPARVVPILPWGATQNSHWVNGGAAILYMGILDGQVAPENPLDNERWISAAAPMYMNLAPPAANRVDNTKYISVEMDEIKEMKTSINTYVNENLALFCTGQKSIERDWDAYVNELNRMGLGRYIELTQSGYDRAMGKK